MSSFKVVSDNFVLGTKGQVVDEKALAGANIAALVESGHLEPVSAKKSTDSESKE